MRFGYVYIDLRWQVSIKEAVWEISVKFIDCKKINIMRKIDRRKFLKKAAGMAVGAIGFPYIIPSSALGVDSSIAASNRITIGLIGVGSHGTAVNLKSFLGSSDAQVVAVCDVDTSRRDRARDMVNEKYDNRDCAAYNDFREIINRDDIDAVMISTPDHWHVPISVAAAKTGKDVQ